VDVFGYALYLARTGRRHRNAKVLSGFGDASVVEVLESFDRGTYRAVYTTRFPEFVAVLHVFQKKSKAGVTTPAVHVAMVRERLKLASELRRSRAK
jgi:phage-related protein